PRRPLPVGPGRGGTAGAAPGRVTAAGSDGDTQGRGEAPLSEARAETPLGRPGRLLPSVARSGRRSVPGLPGRLDLPVARAVASPAPWPQTGPGKGRKRRREGAADRPEQTGRQGSPGRAAPPREGSAGAF